MLTTPTKRLIVYGVAFIAGIGLLIYGVEVGAESVREIAAGIIGAALGAAGLRGVRE